MKITNELVKEFKGKKVLVKFDRPTLVQLSNRERRDITEGVFSFFIGVESNKICYQTKRQRVKGFVMNDEFRYNIKSMEVVDDYSAAIDIVDNCRKILKKLDSRLTSKLRDSILEIIAADNLEEIYIPEYIYHMRFKSIKTYLNDDEIEYMNSCIEQKRPFHWSKSGSGSRGRDLRLDILPCSDGDYVGNFSSEYIGCGNGDYWRLINPTTIMFIEKD